MAFLAWLPRPSSPRYGVAAPPAFALFLWLAKS
jgi:hypothetical protein